MNPRLPRFIFTLLLLISISPAFSANPLQTGKVATVEEIKQKIETLKNKPNLADDIKNRILTAYYDSEDNLNEIQSQSDQAEAYKQALTDLPLQIKQIGRQISEAETLLKNRKPEKLAAIPSDELEQRLIVEKTALSDMDAEISRLESLVGDQLNRGQQIRHKIAEINNKQALSQQQQQDLLIRGGENLPDKEAKQMQLETQVRMLSATLKALELENISAPLRLQAQKDHIHLLSVQREQHSMLIADLENALLDRRQQEIDKQEVELQEAEKAAAGKHVLIQEATKQNMSYNRSLQEVNKNMEQYLAQKNELEQRFKQLEKDYQSAEQKINLAGLSPALGNLLRDQRRNLPQRKQFNDLNDRIQHEIAQTSLETFKLDEVKKTLVDVGQTLLSKMHQQLSADTSDADKLKIRTELRMLLNDQKDLVGRLSGLYAEYARVLGDVDFSLQQLLTSSDKFSAFLDQRLLWVPSAPVIDKHYLQDIGLSLLWFVNPANWLLVAMNFWQGISTYPLLALLGLILVSAEWRFRKAARNRLLKLLPPQNALNPLLFGFTHSLEALTYTLFLTAYVPVLMIWVCVVIKFSGAIDTFSHSFVSGLFAAAQTLCMLQFFYRLFKPSGIAEILFQWRPNTTQILFKQFKWSRFVLVPCVFITAMTGSEAFSEHSYALGRTALMLMMLALSYMFHCLNHPQNGLPQAFYLKLTGWVKGVHYFWYALAVMTPLVIIGFAAAGYYQSALELQQKLVYTVRLIFITILFHELAQGWLTVTKQQLALRNAQQQRKQQVQLAHSPLEAAVIADTELLDLSKINQQSHKLLTTVIVLMLLLGFWMIWNEILPAFSVLDRIVLWQHTEILDGKETLQPITLINVFLGIAYVSLTFMFVSNFPSLVDLLSVGKFEMTAGSRYALIQLVRYLLVSITVLAVANQLGGSWSQVQWLVAAFSVGLGIGLQEIFANMVSGIILLFERPIRVGDTVTVGDITGRVTRIQMRATHIIDWDRKELIVPNKTFITDRLVNWTLSDTVTRIVLPVGVAYGSDVDEVVKVLKEAIKKTPLVLAEPEPKVLLLALGDSALQFTIHVFVHDLGNRLPVSHNLHKNIYEALQAHHIEIPFPQSEVHFRTETINPYPLKPA